CSLLAPSDAILFQEGVSVKLRLPQFYKRINAGDRKGACEAIRWWIKDGGRDCRIRSNNCYGQVSRRDQESALACWGIDR
ncbi:glycoside hydrolase family protein, partial [Escherichia coli]|uniref:glycoside hydrolase family protein n=1 Tax=Escherichia coli TaxID=562 RepID=UPI00207B94E5